MPLSVDFMLILVCCALTLAADKKNCDEGVIYPKEPYFLDGQDLVLTCWRKNKTATSHLYFKNSDGYGRDSLDEMYMERNKTAVMLRIPNISKELVANNSFSSSYYCYDRGKEGKSDVCISNVYVFLDYYPQKAENLSCIIDNWDSMTCTWGLTVKYKIPENYEVSCQFVQNISSEWNNGTVSELLYALRSDSSVWAECPDGNQTSCHWSSRNYNDAMMYIMTVAVTNKRLNITTYMEEKVFRRKDIVKPAPVKATDIAFEYFPEDPESIGSQWNHSSSLRDLLFSLTITSACDPPKVYEVNYTHEESSIYDEEIKHVPAQQMLKGLNPSTQYKFSIKAKAFGGSGPWSEPTEKQFTTLSAVPRSAPHTRNGWFETLPGRCTTARNCENILIHWQPLGQCDIISNTTRYRLSSPLANVTLDSTKFSTEIEVLSNRSSVLQLRAVSEEGGSTNYSMQEVYPEDQWPQIQRDLVIEYNTRTGICNATMVVLKNDSSFDDISHTIVWCAGGAKCEAPFESYVMAEYQTSKILPVSHCQHKYRVGITTSGRRVATGEKMATKISWVPCMFEEGKVPKVPLPAVEIFKISGYAFKVSWSPYTCNTPDINYVQFYRVSHCLVTGTEICSCIGKVSEIDVGKQDNSVKVVLNTTTIKTGSNICVWVKAKTRGGFGPRNTNDLYYTIGELENDKSDANDLAVGLGVGGGVIAFVGIIVFIVWRCRKFKKRFEPVPIDIPVTLNNVTVGKMGHQHTANETETGPLIPEIPVSDSGTHTMSNHSSEGDTQSDRHSRNSNDSGMQQIETEIRNPLSGLLAQGTSRSGYGYNRVPTESDEYLLDGSSRSVDVILSTAENQEENIYDEIDRFPSQLDTECMYLQPSDRPPSKSLDQVQQSKDSAIVTDSANVPDVQDNFASNEEDRSLQAEPVLIENHVHDAKGNFISGSAEDRSLQSESVILQDGSVSGSAMDTNLQTEPVIAEKSHETIMDKFEELECDVSEKELTEDVQERSEFESLPIRCGPIQILNFANEITEETDKGSECLDLPSDYDQCSDFDFHWEHYVPSGNQNLNTVNENSHRGYTSAANIHLSESGSSEIYFDSGSGMENSDASTSQAASNIPHTGISSQEHNVLVDRLETHLDSQQNSEPVHESSNTSNSEVANFINNDKVFIENTLNSKTDRQKHVGNDKLKGGNSSGYSKATFYDQK